MVTASAPVRIADLGGWTDTWFAGHGRVLNLAVAPRVEVEVRPGEAGGGIRIRAESFGDDYRYDRTTAGRHLLIEAAIDAAGLAPGAAHVVTVRSGMPPGAGTGTSAAVLVALMAAFDRLTGRTRAPRGLAADAHALEVSRLGRQSGIQDQIAAACGGVSFIEIPAYPTAVLTAVPLPPALRDALERRLVLVYLGRAHESPAVHEAVIARLRNERTGNDALDRLRQAADAGHVALRAGDLDAFGRALVANTDAQAALHPALVSAEATRIIALARAHGARGWKVNGAGGEGGSVTMLMGDDRQRREAFVAALGSGAPAAREIPITLSADGVRAEGSAGRAFR